MTVPTCGSCGRRMETRRSTSRQAEPPRYCSAACRKHRVRAVDRALEDAVLSLLDARPQDATICPSEAAGAVAAHRPEQLMEPARRAVRRLVARGEVEITQGGRAVDPSAARGPIRVRRTRGG